MTQLIVQGTFDPSKNQLIFNFDSIPQLLNNQTHSVLLSQQSNNQEVNGFSILQQPTFIQKHGLRLGSSALGLAGGVGLLVSCIWSVLLPAIGSIGVIGIACLVNRKITPLHTKEFSSEAVKAQSLFEQRIGSGSSSGSLLDEPAVDTGNLPPPLLPNTGPVLSLINQNKSNILPPPPMPGSRDNATNQSNSALPLPEKEKEFSGKPSTSGASNSEESRANLLSSIRNSFNFMQIKGLLKQNPEKYPSNLLFKELKTTYARALAIGESKILGKTYFKDKIDNFEKNFSIVEQEENQTTKEMENICEKTSSLDSLLKNMKWAQSLLEVLSVREDLFDKTREHCSEKLKSIGKHIDKLQRGNKKEPEETTGASAQETGSSNFTENDVASIDVASILARRVAQEYSDSSGSESKSDTEDEWNP